MGHLFSRARLAISGPGIGAISLAAYISLFSSCSFLSASATASARVESSTAQSPGVIGLRAEMLKTVDTAKVKIGEKFLLKTTDDWQQGGCKVRKGEILIGEVTTLTTGHHGVEWGMQFSSLSCSDPEKGSVRPVLIALRIEHTVPDRSLARLTTAGIEERAIASLFSPNRPGVPAAISPLLNTGDFSHYQSYAGFESPEEEKLKTGQVSGLHGVTMQLPDKSFETKLVSRGQNISISRYSEFVLLMNPVEENRPHERAVGPINLRSAGETTGPKPLQSSPSPEGTAADVCPAGQCYTLASAGTGTGDKPLAAWSLSLAQYGLAANPQKPLSGLDQNVSVLALGDDEVLVAFDPHGLVRRVDAFPGVSWRPRNVRAVLLSRADGHVLSVRDWVVSDDIAPPVWSLGDGRVIAHVEQELITYGPGWTELGRVKLAGPLLFLSSAKSGDLVLIATVHERHTRDQHVSLTQTLEPGEPIEEDYDLTGMTGSLKLIGTRQMSGEPLEPALVANSMLTTKPGRSEVWDLISTTWEGKSSALTKLRSGCEVKVSALAAKLLLARGCARNESTESWFHVLDQDGRVIVRGQTGFGELLQEVETDRADSRIAVGTSFLGRKVERGAAMKESDFQNLVVAIYAKGKAQPIFRANLHRGSSAQQTFSLAPDGLSFAVLTGDTLQNIVIPGIPSERAIGGIAAK